MANYELDVSNTPDTRFRIASLTKTFTAAAIVMLCERGLLALTDKLNKFIPDYPGGDRITVLHLLRHESGVPNPDYNELFLKRVTIVELIERFKHKPLEFEPGTNGKYSNAGYILLAYVVQRVSGTPWEDFLYRNIFKPLGMESTGHVQHEQIISNQASGYLPGPGRLGVENAPWYDVSSSIGSGSLYTSANDLYRWARAVHSERLFKISALNYPYGWGRRKYFDRAGLEQSGLITGFTSNIQIYPGDGLYVICLTNIETTGFNRWATDLAGIVFGKSYEAVRIPQGKGPEFKSTEPFPGEYKSGSGMTVRVFGQ
jgi:CubicO group peptidase (beta-lactamase class C family)